jgi:hypothetical protein
MRSRCACSAFICSPTTRRLLPGSRPWLRSPLSRSVGCAGSGGRCGRARAAGASEGGAGLRGHGNPSQPVGRRRYVRKWQRRETLRLRPVVLDAEKLMATRSCFAPLLVVFSPEQRSSRCLGSISTCTALHPCSFVRCRLGQSTAWFRVEPHRF